MKTIKCLYKMDLTTSAILILPFLISLIFYTLDKIVDSLTNKIKKIWK